MKERLGVNANIPNDLVKKLYWPLRETYPGSLEDFNALIMYLGMMGSIALWDMGLDVMADKSDKIPKSGTKERRQMLAQTMAQLLAEILAKTEAFEDNEMVQKQMIDICENFRRNI